MYPEIEYHEPKVMAEIGCNHMGQLEIAKELLTLAKQCGCEYGKFQKRCPKELLTPEQRGAIQAMAWSPLGDPLVQLSERWGIDVLRVHTGYLDWKRAGVAEQANQIAGEGLALFVPAPWAAFAPGAGSRPLHYHLRALWHTTCIWPFR